MGVLRLKLKIGSVVDKILNKIPAEIWESDSSTFIDPEMGGGQFIVEIVKKLRSYGHADANIQSRVFCISEDVISLNYTLNKNHGLPVTAKVGDITDPKNIINAKFDVVVCSPTFESKLGNSSKNWMVLYQKSLRLVKRGGYVALIIPPTWSSPSKEAGVEEKILTTLTSKFNLIEAAFNLDRTIFNVDASYILFSNQTYQKKTLIGETVYDLSGATMIPFWVDDLESYMMALKELMCVPVTARYIFTDKSTHGITNKMLVDKPKAGYVKFPNTSGKNKPKYGKCGVRGANASLWKKARVGIPKLMCSYIGEAYLTSDPHGKMGCMHNMRMCEIERGEKVSYDESLFRFLKSLNKWNTNYVEVKIMSLLIRGRGNMNKYLSKKTIKLIDKFD